ncbi:MAG: class I adenylate-forming enzyme family protein [Bacilli bacterium]
MNINNKNLHHLVELFAQWQPEKEFLFDDEKSFTSQGFLDKTEKVSGMLLKKGIKKGSVVVFRPERSLPSTILFFSLQYLGAIVFLTDSHDSIEDSLKLSSVKVTPDFCLLQENKETPWNPYTLIDKQGTKFSFSLSDDETDKIYFESYVQEKDIKDPAIVIFTTGSTGLKKPVLLSQNNLIWASRLSASIDLYQENDIGIQLLPLYHIFGLFLIISALITHHSLYYPRYKECCFILHSIEKYRITRIDGVPTLYLSVVKKQKEIHADLSSLRIGMIGGGPSSPNQIDEIEKILGLTLIPVYGMTECLGISSGRLDMSKEERQTTIGRVFKENEVILVDEDHNEVQKGQIGQILVKCPTLMMKYYEDEKSTEHILDANGYLHTGDLAYFDEKKLLHLCGRKKDLIVKGGENLSPKKIEEAILSLDYVDNVAVVGKKDDYYGEIPACLIVLAEGFDISAEKIKADLSDKLFKNEIPGVFAFAKQLPLTSNGKIDKNRVKEIL